MLYTTTSERAIRALAYLARQPAGKLKLVGEMAEAEGLPAPFLGKILQDLVRAGVLRSARGPTGGYTLAVPATHLTLFEIKQIVDGSADLERCAVGLDPCSDETPCPLHATWKPLRNEIIRFLQVTTLAELAAGLSEKRDLMIREPTAPQ